MNETLTTMWTRRSVRKYRDVELPEEDLKLIRRQVLLKTDFQSPRMMTMIFLVKERIPMIALKITLKEKMIYD